MALRDPEVSSIFRLRQAHAGQSAAPVVAVLAALVIGLVAWDAYAASGGSASADLLSRFLPRRAELLAHLKKMPQLGAGMLVLIALLSLAFGHKVLRLSLSLAFGCTTFVLLTPALQGVFGAFAGTAAGCAAAVITGAGGWHLYELEQTLLAAALGALVGAAVGIWMQLPWLTWVLGLALAVAAVFGGRKLKQHLSIAETSLFGALLAAIGIMAFFKTKELSTVGLAGLGTALFCLGLGLVLQLKVIKAPAGGGGGGGEKDKK